MEIQPFRGWRYAAGANGDVSSLIAPPYDVLSAEDKQALLDADVRNIVAVDLPHTPAKEVGPDEAYQQAARTLVQWQGEGVLCQSEAPSLYCYEQTFRWAGREYTRHALIGGIRATELGQDVIPHEHTFEGPKADRLKLNEYTRTQLSPIFGFYEDPDNAVGEQLVQATRRQPEIQGKLSDVEHKLWEISEPDAIQEIAALLRPVPVFIADGHHRYTTGLNYRNRLRDNEHIDYNHPANFVMFCLVARSDPGLLVLPTHRIIRGLRKDFTINKLVSLCEEFDWQRCSVDTADLTDADVFLRRYGPGTMAFLGASPAEIWIAKLRDTEAMVRVAPEQTDTWRALEVSILHKMIIDKALNQWRTDDLFIDYTPDGRRVLAACESNRASLGVCLQSTPLQAVETIALSGASMPHKSTYFYPKVATGMVLMPLA